jgi:hypothetical protein
MDKCKPITSHLASHFKLSHDDCPKDNKKKKEMKNVSYASAVGSLMYAMVCTRLNIDHAIYRVLFIKFIKTLIRNRKVKNGRSFPDKSTFIFLFVL